MKEFVLLPPPNETGTLHSGHFLMNTILDFIVRSKNIILNKEVYICPGMDHGGIAMQIAARKYYNKEPNFHEIQSLAKVYREGIANDLKKWNLSFDWSKNHYTMSAKHNELVTQTFIKLYNHGFITRKYAMINWDTGLNTAISDLEVEMIEKESLLYYIDYQTTLNETITVATTRPETIFADVCLMINVNDLSKTKYIEQYAYIPIINKKIPILCDEYVDMNYGTGVLKVTPGHDIHDAELAKKHKLPILNIINHESKITFCELNLNETQQQAANECLLNGNTVENVRNTIVQKLNLKSSKIKNKIPISMRSQKPVETCMKMQWFLSMSEAVKLAKNANITLYPINQFDNLWNMWLNNTRDWCISRSSPWGHKIPVWYNSKGNMIVSEDAPSDDFIQTDETLDTWFSSALWPISYEKSFGIFSPFNPLVTGHDILFFWVARMIMLTLLIKKIDNPNIDIQSAMPFTQVYLHGLVRDEKNRKMSKTVGNVINPFQEASLYEKEYNMNGYDVLKLSFLLQVSPNSNIQMRKESIRARNIITKINNACEFLLKCKNIQTTEKSELYIYFQNRLQQFINQISHTINNLTIHEYVNLSIDFLYEICDYLLEFYKVYNDLYEILYESIRVILQSFHAIIPTTSSELYKKIYQENMQSVNKRYSTLIEFIPQHDIINLIKQLRMLNGLQIKYYYNNKYFEIVNKLCSNYINFHDKMQMITINKYIIYIEIHNIELIKKYVINKQNALEKLKITDNMPLNIKNEYNMSRNIIEHELQTLNNILNI